MTSDPSLHQSELPDLWDCRQGTSAKAISEGQEQQVAPAPQLQVPTLPGSPLSARAFGYRPVSFLWGSAREVAEKRPLRAEMAPWTLHPLPRCGQPWSHPSLLPALRPKASPFSHPTAVRED